jgi:hypothetical protein
MPQCWQLWEELKKIIPARERLEVLTACKAEVHLNVDSKKASARVTEITTTTITSMA